MSKSLKIFFIESPSPLDFLQDITEVRALEEICKILGYKAKRTFVSSKKSLVENLNYISSIFEFIDTKDNEPICIHISTHGNNDGLGFGNDFINWEELFKIIQPIFKKANEYSKDVILIISACGAGKQKMTDEFKKLTNLLDEISPPKYIFVTDEEVSWEDALIAWSNFYHQLTKIELDKKTDVQKILDKIKSFGEITLKYFRWDDLKNKYLSYTPKS